MEYEIVYAPRAKIEIFEVLSFYFERSPKVASDFNPELKYIDTALTINLFYEIKYKNVRAIPLNTFPYSFFFTVNETSKIVEVLSCFHQKQNPIKLPKP